MLYTTMAIRYADVPYYSIHSSVRFILCIIYTETDYCLKCDAFILVNVYLMNNVVVTLPLRL